MKRVKHIERTNLGSNNSVKFPDTKNSFIYMYYCFVFEALPCNSLAWNELNILKGQIWLQIIVQNILTHHMIYILFTLDNMKNGWEEWSQTGLFSILSMVFMWGAGGHVSNGSYIDISITSRSQFEHDKRAYTCVQEL